MKIVVPILILVNKNPNYDDNKNLITNTHNNDNVTKIISTT